MTDTGQTYTDTLREFLVSKGVLHRFIEFEDPVRTGTEAAKKVPADAIIKSIVLIGSDKKPVLAILPARNKISYRKVKILLNLKDIRLAQPDEVLEHSGYPVGGVPPFTKIGRVLLDKEVRQREKSIAGGGDVNKLVELETRQLLEVLDPVVADLSV